MGNFSLIFEMNITEEYFLFMFLFMFFIGRGEECFQQPKLTMQAILGKFAMVEIGQNN